MEDPVERLELLFGLGLSFQLVLTEFVRRLDALGYEDLRPVHGYAFQALRWGGLTSTELAGRLGVTKQAAGQMIDELERKGYVSRHPHPDGGRRRLVVLTDKAQRHLAVAGETLHALERELGEKVDVPALRDQLATLIKTLQDGKGPLPPLRPVW
ncbi:DNA-binding MarR family transcriptional regulator [Thermocatellispora tengchongensis]|uniref:DNA-binding MarR family transcriptional regulator n=1 Tax=Thermocatellispora tengchongensis TaxID=1073253 RepID=A0A840PFD4_9ACTN|nr:MarR family transcriptional regulator [Thermocatellispora tengchongensis]MBB5136551.1 DNA-binding MarR family transcriptional regulator [Thermocatellispora tengchongensis]